ncbi:MAG: hypothetical protein VX619_04055 [bacterium]|nr:hypothetical protein [bacterium]
MEILVNRKKIDIDTTEIHTLQELVKTIEENIISQAGHVLTQIEVNQICLSDEQEAEYAQFPVNQIEQLSINSCPPYELVLSGLEDSLQILPQIIETLGSCVTKLSEDVISEAMDEFIVATDGIQWFTTIINGSISVYGSNINEKGDFIRSSIQLSEILNEILEAHSNSDITAFGDLIEYELEPILEKMLKQIPSYLSELKGIKL